MTGIKRRIERLEEKTGVKDENPIKAIEVLFVELGGTVTGSMLIDLTKGGPRHEADNQARKGA